jgi:shikimate 5-dehydrogenase
MAPKFKDMWMVVMGAGGTAKAALNAVNGTIDSMTKTAVFFSR